MARLHSIRTACKLSPEMRTEEHIEDILSFVKDVAFFSKLTELQQQGLCRAMTIEVFNRGDSVFEIGQPGEKFYIILSGGVGVQLPTAGMSCPNNLHSAENCTCSNQQFETAVFLEKGMGFGELALQSDQPRSATISASEVTELLVTKRADYEKYAGELHRQFIEQRVKFLRRCPRIEDALKCGLISPQDIAAMANCLCEASLSGNALVCRQGDLVDRMIFVRSGQLLMLRAVDMDPSRPASPVVPPPEKDLEHSPESPEFQRRTAKSEFTLNFAKAMMDIKKKERQAKLHEIHTEEESVLRRKSFQRSHNKFTKAWSSGGSRPSLSSQDIKAPPKEPDSPAGNKGGMKWSAVRTAMKHATILSGLCEEAGEKPQAQAASAVDKGLVEAQNSIAHFQSVAAMRRRVTDIQVSHIRELTQNQRRRPQSQFNRKRGTTASASSSTARRRRHLLRMGAVGPYQYYGDHQLCTNESYPVSLVSDPVAEIYVMSKSDILRRLPKKILAALFTMQQDAVPTDAQLLEMHKQTKRWDAFCKGMHAEALSSNGHGHAHGVPRQLHATHSNSSRIDVAGNLAFLGVSATSDYAKSIIAPVPHDRGVVLTHKEEREFSDASARFLRRFGAINRDPGLRNALAKDGLIQQQRASQSFLEDDNNEEGGAMSFRMEQYWSKLRRDPIGLDLDDALNMAETLRDDAAESGDAFNADAFKTSGDDGRKDSKGLRLPSVRGQAGDQHDHQAPALLAAAANPAARASGAMLLHPGNLELPPISVVADQLRVEDLRTARGDGGHAASSRRTTQVG